MSKKDTQFFYREMSSTLNVKRILLIPTKYQKKKLRLKDKEQLNSLKKFY